MGIYRGAGGAGDAVNDASSEAVLVQQLANEAQADADAASASATAAAGSASAASTSASNASTSASNAATSATNASNSASSASTSATNAANSATAAQTAETAAELAETNAETAQAAAASSASAASSSATTASTAATNASNSASAASTSATNASNSASAASTSASNASTSATSASGSASSATTSASNAATSETNASNSATSASTSASTATTQAGIATTQATNAASSASAASTSATNASNSASTATTQATNASNSASAAATSATNAAASFDSFDDRYLGSKSSAPSVDNDGNTLLVGALYFNSVDSAMKVWNGTAWLDAYASLSGALIATNNLADLNNTATARTNLGLGTIATQAASNVAITGGTINGTTVGGASAAAGNFTTLGATGVATFSAGTVSAPAITTTGDTNTGIYFPAADTIAFTEGGIEAMRIDSSANVGIGTSSPAFKLEVKSTGSTTSQFERTDGIYVLQLKGSGTTATGALGMATNDMVMLTNGTERMRITSAGNLGIGVTPSAWSGLVGVQVKDRLALSGFGGNSYITNNSFYGSLGFTYLTTNPTSQLRFSDNLFIFANAASGTAGTAVTYTERMRIDASGNLGIGTTSPTVALDVAGAVKATGLITASGATSGFVTDATNGYALFTGDPGSYNLARSGTSVVLKSAGAVALQSGSGAVLVFNTNGASERMRIDSSGNVGIGTSSPAAQLDVGSHLLLGLANDFLSNSSSCLIARTSAAGTGIFSEAGHLLLQPRSSFGRSIIFATGSTTAAERMRIDSSGNVGIGTSSPNAKLQTDSSSTTYSANIRVRNSNFGNGVIGAASGILTVATDMNNLAFYTASNLGVDGTSVPTNERMRIDSSGNLLFNSGYGSVATAYGCRAWVNFNGTGTVAIRASGNVSSITDNGTGDYTANFTTAMPDVNYSVATNASDLANSGRQSCPRAIATGSVRILTTDTPGLTTDYTYVSIAVFR